jgi:hypothetical protein
MNLPFYNPYTRNRSYLPIMQLTSLALMRSILALRYSYFITILQQNIVTFVFDVGR